MEPKTGKQKLEALIAEIEAMDEGAYTPEQEMSANETLLGDLPIFLRKMYSLRMFYKQEAEMLKVKLSFTPTKEKEEAFKNWERADDMSDILDNLFWPSCKEFFGYYDTPKSSGVGLRKDWKFVLQPYDSNNTLQELLRRIIPPQEQ